MLMYFAHHQHPLLTLLIPHNQEDRIMNHNYPATRSFTTRRRVTQSWPSGPWDKEPDEVHWIDAATLRPCIATRAPLGYWIISVAYDPSVSVEESLWKFGGRIPITAMSPYAQHPRQGEHAYHGWHWATIQYHDYNPMFGMDAAPIATRRGEDTNYTTFGDAFDDATALATYIQDVQHSYVRANLRRMCGNLAYMAVWVAACLGGLWFIFN